MSFRPGRRGSVVAICGVLAVAACGSASGGGTAPATTTARPAATTSTPYDPIAACARKLDYWITTDFLQGQPDRGDYQEMGLSGAEGLALRQLEGELGATIKTFPAPAPPNLKQHESQDCAKAGAASPNAAGWP